MSTNWRHSFRGSKTLSKGGHPSTSQLITAFTALVQNFTYIYLVIDALDESSERERLLDLLIHIVDDNDLKRVQLLIMSRKEIANERALLKVSMDMPLSNPYVDEGVGTYVHSELSTSRKFQYWNEALRSEIEEALVAGATGMYVELFLIIQVFLILLSPCGA